MHVDALELKPGGTLTYTMTAVGAEQVAFMEQAGMPLSTASTKTFTAVEPVRQLAYTTVADFIPGVEPYDEVWTGRLAAGRANEMDNLANVAGK